ncbi:MAG: RNA methyltransferase [Chlorobiaceae bacterium]
MKHFQWDAVSKVKLRKYAKLHQKKQRDREGLFLAEGLRTVRELCQNLPDEDMLVALLIRESESADIRFAEAYSGKAFSISEKECLLLAQTTTPQGIFGVFRQQRKLESFDEAGGGLQGSSFIVALDDVQDPGNVGTILRTAAWFGIDAVICSLGTADRYNAKALRASAGSIFAASHYEAELLIAELKRLKSLGYCIVSASLDGKDFREFSSRPEKQVLVIGNEANGVSKQIHDLSDRLVKIPHGGKKTRVESLNAAVSAAILIERLMIF